MVAEFQAHLGRCEVEVRRFHYRLRDVYCLGNIDSMIETIASCDEEI